MAVVGLGLRGTVSRAAWRAVNRWRLAWVMALLLSTAVPSAEALDQIRVEGTYPHDRRSKVTLNLGFVYLIHHDAAGESRRWLVQESDTHFAATDTFTSRTSTTPYGDNVPFADTSKVILGDGEAEPDFSSDSGSARFSVKEEDPPVRLQYRRILSLYESAGSDEPYEGPVDQVEVVYDLMLDYTPDVPGIGSYPEVETVYVNFFASGTQPEERPGVEE